jgi:hypothetical protein
MHTVRMILEHVVVCKAVDLALHQLWAVLKKAFDAALSILSAFLFGSLLKELERIQHGLGVLFLLAAMGVLSTVSVGLLKAKTSNVG